jgi:signal transduction histidine kinase
MFKLLRFYALTSFIMIFATAALLTLFYRQMTLHWIDHLARSNSQAVAQMALNSVAPELADHLASGGGAGLPPAMATHLHRMAQDTSVSDIWVYARDGTVAFATRAGAVPSGHYDDPDFLAALDGNAASSMVFRDLFNRFAGTNAEDNQMHTYIPIRSGPAGAVLGVFETHTNMSHLIEENNRVLLLFLMGAELILALLYTVLYFIVRHARNIIDSQHRTILDRTSTLEILSRRLLKGEELNKKKIATDLHEGLAQTLSAIKINMESKALATISGASAPPLESIVPVLQSAIQEVRSIATELRPASLDDLGLLPTLNWFCREFEQTHPEIHVQREISLAESVIPVHLKIEIYRIIESAFRNIAKYSNTDQIRFMLHLADDMIHLVIGDAPTTQRTAAGIVRFDPGAVPQFRFAEVKERTALSGGTFSTTLENAGWVMLRSSWARAA